MVTLVSGEDTSSVINGLTITHGMGTWSEMFQSKAGGGVLCINAGVKIINCNIINNELIHDDIALGAGIFCMISNGNFNIIIEDNTISDNTISVTNTMAGGGGVLVGAITPAASITALISDNIFMNNTCECDIHRADGGAIKTMLETMASGSFYITGNTIVNNSIRGGSTRGGGLCGTGNGGYVYDNYFNGNYIDSSSGQFRGAAITYKTTSSDLEIVNNQFIENNSPINASDGTGAVSIMDSYENRVFVDRNYFYRNEGQFGAAFMSRRGYNLMLTNNIFSENAGQKGGCIQIYNPETDNSALSTGYSYISAGIINNSFINNTAEMNAGAVRFSGLHTPPVIFNSIFFNNSAPDGPDIKNEDDEKITVSYSRIIEDNISGVWSGINNIMEDPLFCDDSCHLDCSTPSPCINKGIPELEIAGITYYAPGYDMDGESRPLDDLFDIGADEEKICTAIPEYSFEQDRLNLSLMPNPSNGLVNIRYTLERSTDVNIKVISLTGESIESQCDSRLNQGDHHTKLNLSHLPGGIYLLRLQAGEQAASAKIVLNK